MNVLLWTGLRELIFALVQPLVLHIFMRKLNHILSTEILKLVIYFLMATFNRKLEILGWQNFFLTMSHMLVPEWQEQCKHDIIGFYFIIELPWLFISMKVCNIAALSVF